LLPAPAAPPWHGVLSLTLSCHSPPTTPQVVETFIQHTTRHMLVCAPMYAPFWKPGSGGAELGAELAGATPVLSIPVAVGDRKHLVDVYVTAEQHDLSKLNGTAGTENNGSSGGGEGSNGNGSRQEAGGTAEGQRPVVFFLLLASDVFSTRTRGTIYQHARWGRDCLLASFAAGLLPT